MFSVERLASWKLLYYSFDFFLASVYTVIFPTCSLYFKQLAKQWKYKDALRAPVVWCGGGHGNQRIQYRAVSALHRALEALRRGRSDPTWPQQKRHIGRGDVTLESQNVHVVNTGCFTQNKLGKKKKNISLGLHGFFVSSISGSTFL